MSTRRTLLCEPLPAAPDDAAVFPFTDADLLELRAYVAAVAGGLGFGRDRSGDIVLAVDEVATNSYRHGGGGGGGTLPRLGRGRRRPRLRDP